MKNTGIKIFLVAMLLGLSFYGQAEDLSTDLWVSNPPSPSKVRAAIQKLESALADQNSIRGKYVVKINEARNLLEYEDGTVTFQAQIFCDGKNALTDEEDVPNCPVDMCYKGDIGEAVKLLRAALARDLLNYSDENYFEKPRIKKGKLFLDDVDGPNELRETFEVDRCK